MNTIKIQSKVSAIAFAKISQHKLDAIISDLILELKMAMHVFRYRKFSQRLRFYTTREGERIAEKPLENTNSREVHFAFNARAINCLRQLKKMGLTTSWVIEEAVFYHCIYTDNCL